MPSTDSSDLTQDRSQQRGRSHSSGGSPEIVQGDGVAQVGSERSTGSRPIAVFEPRGHHDRSSLPWSQIDPLESEGRHSDHGIED